MPCSLGLNDEATNSALASSQSYITSTVGLTKERQQISTQQISLRDLPILGEREHGLLLLDNHLGGDSIKYAQTLLGDEGSLGGLQTTRGS